VWFNAFPLSAGLGNLHVRLAFNNSVFLYDALMNTGLLAGFTINLSLGLLVSVVAAELSCNALSAASWRRSPTLAAASIIALPLLVVQVSAVAFEGLSPDIVLYCCELEITLLLIAHMRRLGDRAASVDVEWLTLVVLAGVSCSIKLSAAALMFTAVAWVLLTGGRASTRTTLTGCVLVFSTLGAWVAGNIALSGYPVFPSPVVPFAVFWRIPLETARQNLGWIQAWARLVEDDSMRVPYDQILSRWSWVGPWLRHIIASTWEVTIPIALSAVVLAVIGGSPRLRRRITLQKASVLLVPLASLTYWFATAPDLRFAGASFVLLLMLACALILEAASAAPTMARYIGASICALSLLLGVKQTVNMWTWWRSWPAEITFGHVPIPATSVFTTANGIGLRVPVVDEACWAAPPPCTPYPSAMLDFNRPNELASGFRVVPFRDDVVVGWWTAEHPWQDMKP
jgi:hypothetical protein